MAHGLAWLEERVRQWPKAWGNVPPGINLRRLRPPRMTCTTQKSEVSNRKREAGKHCRRSSAHRAARKGQRHGALHRGPSGCRPPSESSSRRPQTLHQWGHGALGWWSWFTHESGGGTLSKLSPDIEPTIAAALDLRAPVRRHVEAALFWVREPRRSIFESHRPTVLRTYSAYWNAFECLVEAVCLMRPPDPTKTQKQSRINAHLIASGGTLTAEDIQVSTRRWSTQSRSEGITCSRHLLWRASRSQLHSRMFQIGRQT